jgi:Asp/Glu/hydantoin racemase
MGLAYEAVRTASKVGVLATLPTTLAPTVRLVKTQAEKAGRSVSVIEGLATGAYECLVANQVDKHEQLILETAEKLASEADVLVLAQGSMARMEEELTRRTRRSVLSSPRRGVLAVKEILEGSRSDGR